MGRRPVEDRGGSIIMLPWAAVGRRWPLSRTNGWRVQIESWPRGATTFARTKTERLCIPTQLTGLCRC